MAHKVKKNNSHLTAISRNKISAPLKTLYNLGLINHAKTILDFGCGKGYDFKWLRLKGFNAAGFDPYWSLDYSAVNNKYDIVLCTYVFNVIGLNQREETLNTLKKLITPNGKIYITVRRDLKKDYITKRGTEQYLVKLPHKVVKENSQYCIYEINNG